MCAPDAPEPPDPQETSAAQTGTNIGTAIANNTMGMVDQVTPYGSLTYDQTGTYTYEDPYTGQTYDLPTYTSTTELSPEQQYILDQNLQSQSNLADVAVDRSDFLKDYLPQTEAMTDAIDQKLYDLGSKRLDPRFEQRREDMQTRLVNQGIAPGSEAYNREMQGLGQQENDAYNQLLLQGRGQAAAEVNMPINQITALLSGSQVQNPNVSMMQPQGAPTTDVAGLINSNYNQRLNIWQQEAAQRGGLLGGLFGAAGQLGAAAISDRRLKDDIVKVGEIGPLNVYEFRYLGTGKVRTGFMADEVERVAPEAVIYANGFAAVDYGKALEAI